MTRITLYHVEPKLVRNTLNKAAALAEKMRADEKELILLLREIDEKRFFVRYGYNSLTGFCRYGLRFGKTQSQRIVTEVRRSMPTSNFGHEEREDSQESK